MNHQLPSIENLAIKQLLVRRLQAALDLYISDCSLQTQLKSQISLHLAQEQQRVLYVCAIAFQLTQAIGLPAMEIARAIAQLVCCQTEELNFTVQVVPPGWIHLEITEPSLATWLQNLVISPPMLQSLPQTQLSYQRERDTSCLFAVQYAHARCCSLIQLAHREGLMVLRSADSECRSAFWLVVTPNPIPWLNLEQKLCLCHPAERAAIAQLLAVLDDLYCHCPSHKPINWHKSALNLSQAFQTFYSHCRIWGEVKSQNLPLAQARLGLVLITQSVLRLLLENHLGIEAPVEL